MAGLLASTHQLVAGAAAAGKTVFEATVLADFHPRYTQMLAVGRLVNPTPANGGRQRTAVRNLIDRLELHVHHRLSGPLLEQPGRAGHRQLYDFVALVDYYVRSCSIE